MPRNIISKKEQMEGLKKAMHDFSGVDQKSDGKQTSPGAATNGNDKDTTNGGQHGFRRLSHGIGELLNTSNGRVNSRRNSREIYIDTPSLMDTERRRSLPGQIVDVPLADEDHEKPRNVWKEIKISVMKEYPRALRRNMSNPLWVLLLIEFTIVVFPWSGLRAFSIKYVIFEYHVSQADANLARGFSSSITVIIATVISSKITTYIKSRRSYLYLIVTTLILSLCVLSPGFVIGCGNNQILGKPGALGGEVLNLNRSCDCSDTQPLLSCGDDGMTYLSPCHAGCQYKNGTSYTDCANLATQVNGNDLHTDTCDLGCWQNFIIYNVVLATSAFLYTLSYMPRQLLSLRITQPEDRGVALAVLFFVALIVGIPGPTVFGKILDTACVVWTGQCQYYDRDTIRYIQNGTDISTTFMAALLYGVMIIICIRQDARMQGQGQEEVGPPGEGETEKVVSEPRKDEHSSENGNNKTKL